MTYSFTTFNVKGIASKGKRLEMFEWLRQQNYSFNFLQEVHCTPNNYEEWKSQWKGDMFLSGNQSNSAGIGILINSNVVYKFISYRELKQGRLQLLNIEIDGKDIYLINIYGPNKDDVELINILDKTLIENNSETFIIGGDFNTTLDNKKDKLNGNLDTHKKCSVRIKEVMENNDLCDIWRIKNHDIKQYTWHSNTNPPIFCRLDYFLISSHILNLVKNCNIKPGYKSDHSIVTFDLDFFPSTTERGPGFFKINNSILLDNEFKTTVLNAITEIVNINNDCNPNTLWELIKGTVRNVAIKYSSKKQKAKKIEEASILKNIEQFESDLALDPQNVNITENLNVQRKLLNDIREEKIKGILLRTRAEWVEGAEKNTKYFANLERKKAESKTIKQIRTNDGYIEKDTNNVLTFVKNFYGKLYKKNPTIQQEDSFLRMVTILCQKKIKT